MDQIACAIQAVGSDLHTAACQNQMEGIHRQGDNLDSLQLDSLGILDNCRLDRLDRGSANGYVRESHHHRLNHRHRDTSNQRKI